jgi:hypothetical protein
LAIRVTKAHNQKEPPTVLKFDGADISSFPATSFEAGG